MKRPTTHDYFAIIAIGAVLCLLALVAAFSGAGFAAIVVLVVVIGPAAIYGNRLLGNIARRGPERTERPRSISH